MLQEGDSKKRSARIKTITQNFFFHIHSPKAHPFSLKPTYTFGLGLILGFLFLILVVTGLVKEQSTKIGYTAELERAGCEILSDCCTCLSPLISKESVDAVTTNSIKGAFYLKNSNGVGVNLKPLLQIVEDETR